MCRFLILFASLLSAFHLGAIDYEARLIPVAAAGAAGAYGTRWTTRAMALTETDIGVEIVGDLPGGLPGSIGRSQPYRIAVLPSENEPPGAIVYVQADVAESVHISARLLQRGSTISDDTVLPVVPQSEFRNRTLYFLQLKQSAEERLHLRVYSLDLDAPSPAVRVRIQAHSVGTSWSFVHDEVYSLRVEQKETMSMEGQVFPVRPLALELQLDPLLALIPQDADLAVSVIPLSDIRVWAMVSETHVLTQRVRISVGE